MTAVRKGLDSLFVVETTKGWSVQPAVEPNKSIVYPSKDEALQKARAAAKAKHGEVFIFNQAGSLIGQEPAA